MRLAFPVSALAFCLLVHGCSGGLPDGAGGSDSSSVPGASTSPPAPQFSVSATDGTAPFTVTFAQLDTSGTTSWKWEFGDGAECGVATACTPAPATPEHTYTTAGVFSVTLIASGPGGTRVAHIEDAIEVRPPLPVAAFSVNTASGPPPLAVTFTNTSTNATTYSWTFGDGGTSSAASPSHTYTQDGQYVAVLHAFGPGGTGETSRVIAVQSPAPNPAFIARVGGVTVELASGPLPLPVQFVQSNTAFTTSRTWLFGDGATSTQATPTRTYVLPGSFDVMLTANGPGGSASLTRFGLVEAWDELADGSFEGQSGGQAPGGPWTSFAGHLGGLTGHNVFPFSSPLTDLGMPSQGARWAVLNSFSTGHATPPSNPGGVTSPAVGAAGALQDFSFRANRSRLRFDAVFVTNEAAGENVFRDWASVDVTLGSTTRNLFFKNTLSPLTGGDSTSIAGLQRSTTLQSVNVDLAQLFAGSGVGSLFRITAQVGNVGSAFPVRDSYLFVDNLRLETIANPIVANFSANPLNANLGEAVHFTDLSTGNPVAWAWDLGDGTTSTLQNPIRAYQATGPKTIRLTASRPGSSDSLTRTDFVTVYSVPNASFTATPTSGRAPLRVTLNNTSLNQPGVTYEWRLDGVLFSTAEEPISVVVQNEGTTTTTPEIVLTALRPTNSNQATSTVPVELTVLPEARYSTDIYPILHGMLCVGCHSAPPTNGNFDFNSTVQSDVYGWLTGNETICDAWDDAHPSDRYVVAGNLADSFLWQKVGVNTQTQQGTPCLDRVMPTSGSNENLIGLLRSWIEGGASFP